MLERESEFLERKVSMQKIFILIAFTLLLASCGNVEQMNEESIIESEKPYCFHKTERKDGLFCEFPSELMIDDKLAREIGHAVLSATFGDAIEGMESSVTEIKDLNLYRISYSKDTSERERYVVFINKTDGQILSVLQGL